MQSALEESNPKSSTHSVMSAHSSRAKVASAESRQGPLANSQRIRNNLIFKLGVDPDKSSAQRNLQHSKDRPPASMLGNAKVTKEPLKYDDGSDEEDMEPTHAPNRVWPFSSLFASQPEPEDSEKDTAHTSLEENPTSSLSSSLSSREGVPGRDEAEDTDDGKRKLSFNEQVEVCLIPKKEEYSKRIRGFLWNSPEDLVMNAQRNTVEFASEGWNWRNAMEDENMYRCVQTNELIHPIHIEQQMGQGDQLTE